MPSPNQDAKIQKTISNAYLEAASLGERGEYTAEQFRDLVQPVICAILVSSVVIGRDEDPLEKLQDELSIAIEKFKTVAHSVLRQSHEPDVPGLRVVPETEIKLND